MTTTSDKVKRELDELPGGMTAAPDPRPVSLLARIEVVRLNTLDVDLGGGVIIEVLKPTKVTPAMDQAGSGFTYDYTSGDGQARTSSASGEQDENQVVVPAFFTGDVVEIGPAPTNVAAFSSSLGAFRFQVANSPAYWFKKNEEGA